MNYSKPKAFTLVEILVVIAVIGLLSSIIFAITRGADEQGRIARGLYFSQHLQNSLGSYAAGIWSFDEGSGTAANDISGWENDGSLVNSPTWRCAATDTSYTPSGQGCSLGFNGVDDYVDVGNGASLQIYNKVTYEAWIKVNSFEGITDDTIVSRGWQPIMWLYSGWKITFSIDKGGGNAAFTYGPTPNLGQWYHVVGTYDNSLPSQNLKIYIDGKLEETADYTEVLTGTTSVGIGKLLAQANSNFSGLIDEVRIYATSLTSAQIQSQYYAGLQRLLAKKSNNRARIPTTFGKNVNMWKTKLS